MDAAADLDLIAEAAYEGGQIALGYFGRSPPTWAKAGGSPVTEADLAVDRMLAAKLRAARPDYGWLSEESLDDPTRLRCETIFAVDPIDGTRGFIAGDDRWCVSIAVVHRGRPTAAALAVPVRGELLTAALGRGSWRSGQRLAASSRPGLAGASVAGPSGWIRSAGFGDSIQRRSYVPSLAFRIAMVATGAVDVAIASPNANDWDVAAADLLVHESGGQLIGLGGTPPVYNCARPVHGALLASNEPLGPAVLAALRDVAAERALAGLPV